MCRIEKRNPRIGLIGTGGRVERIFLRICWLPMRRVVALCDVVKEIRRTMRLRWWLTAGAEEAGAVYGWAACL